MTQVPTLTDEQRKALDWVVAETLEIAWERDLEPAEALNEASDLLVLAELVGREELVEQAVQLSDRATAAFAALPEPTASAEQVLREIRHQIALGLGSSDPKHWEAALQEANNTLVNAFGPEA